MPTLLRALAALALLLVALPVTAQGPMFDPNEQLGVDANVSGDDECDDEHPYICNQYKQSINAATGELDEMLSTLEFGFAAGKACSVTAPRPVSGMQVVPSGRRWNECPNGRANRTHRLSTTDLPGPDYGLNRLRICTDSDGRLQGVEARFFKLPQASWNSPGQDVATRTFERNGCSEWQSWSTCSVGRSASGMRIYANSLNAGDVKGIRLVCRRVIAPATLQRN